MGGVVDRQGCVVVIRDDGGAGEEEDSGFER